eukprot:767579-Hanusia_phi.AAC.11
MLACISPSNTHLNESVRTLEYASRAKNIKNKPGAVVLQQSMVKELQKEIEALRAENRALKQALLTKSNADLSMLRCTALTPVEVTSRQGGNFDECPGVRQGDVVSGIREQQEHVTSREKV